MNLQKTFQKLENLYKSQEAATSVVFSRIGCKGAGCSDCCRHVAVRASIIEGAYICKHLSKMDAFLLEAVRDNIVKFDAIYKKFGKGIVEREGKTDLEVDEEWLLNDKIIASKIESCPFLINDSCSIYNARPLACRRYVVQNKSSLCVGSQDTGILDKLNYKKICADIEEKAVALGAVFGDRQSRGLYPLVLLARMLDLGLDMKPRLYFAPGKPLVCEGNLFKS